MTDKKTGSKKAGGNIPAELRTTFEARPDIEFAYVANGEWAFKEAAAKRLFPNGYQAVKNTFHKK